MKRWFFILLGGLGVSLVAAAAVAMACYKPLGNNGTLLFVLEWVFIIGGFLMGVIGFINGRNAGELDISKYMKTPRRDYGVDGNEIDFACPNCGKHYRASPLLEGRPFTCRDCRKVFEVSPSNGSPTQLPNQLPGPMERRLLPAPG